MSKLFIKIIISILILLNPNFYGLSLAKAQTNISPINNFTFNNYLQYFYNRYSHHFDQYGLVYAIPDYGINKFKKVKKIREWLSLVSYYKYRASNNDQQAREIMRLGILNGYRELLIRGRQSQSFQEAEAYFITIRLLDELPNLLDQETKDIIDKILNVYLEDGIKALDTENRAIVAGAHWQYINNYLFNKKIISTQKKEYFDRLIKDKIDNAIAQSINSDYWYLENNFQDFSVHYHAVSAFMLMVYGDLTKNKKYLNIAQQMYNNLKRITLFNGEIPNKLGHRPSALGAQFYLMTGLLAYYFNDNSYMSYLSFAGGNRFFQDHQHPDRLEFHSKNIFNDDYAFSDIAEWGLVIPKFKNISLYYQVSILKSKQEFIDHTFYIKNSGQDIILNKV